MSSFHTQGAVPLDSPAYIQRGFEERAVAELLNQNWVLLLGPREHGKSSGLLRIKAMLREEDLTVLTLDLQNLPPCSTYQELLTWVTNHVARELDVRAPELYGDDARELTRCLELTLPKGSSPVVIIIDEVANIPNDELRNSFYGQIRGISTARGEAPPDALPRRLRFLFAGMFRPESMVHPLNSPFNVCERLETEDLRIEQIRHLVAHILRGEEGADLDEETIRYIDRAYALVGGHPYMLQYILSKTLQVSPLDRDTALDTAIDTLKYSDMHTSALLTRVIADPAVSRIAAQLATQGALNIPPGDNDYKHICILGLARREGTQLQFRNNLYADLARSSPQLRPEESIATPGSLVVAFPENAFSFMRHPGLREFTYAAQRGAANAFNTGSYRLALVGFGSAIEAILIDWLQTLTPAELTTAIRSVSRIQFNRPFEDVVNPGTWRLVNLVKVSRQVRAPSRAVDPPEALREFRNTVHPSVAVATGLSESRLLPEATQASGFFTMVLRDVEDAMT